MKQEQNIEGIFMIWVARRLSECLVCVGTNKQICAPITTRKLMFALPAVE